MHTLNKHAIEYIAEIIQKEFISTFNKFEIIETEEDLIVFPYNYYPIYPLRDTRFEYYMDRGPIKFNKSNLSEYNVCIYCDFKKVINTITELSNRVFLFTNEKYLNDLDFIKKCIIEKQYINLEDLYNAIELLGLDLMNSRFKIGWNDFFCEEIDNNLLFFRCFNEKNILKICTFLESIDVEYKKIENLAIIIHRSLKKDQVILKNVMSGVTIYNYPRNHEKYQSTFPQYRIKNVK
jgi:hypothetical protein